MASEKIVENKCPECEKGVLIRKTFIGEALYMGRMRQHLSEIWECSECGYKCNKSLGDMLDEWFFNNGH